MSQSRLWLSNPNEKLNVQVLMSRWREQRAARLGVRASRAGAILCSLASFIDVLFQMPAVVLVGDVAMMVGSLASLYLSRQKIYSASAWSPLYFGGWIACGTSLWSTGGIQSPLMGTFLALLLVAGLVIQSQIRPLIIVIFIAANLIFWWIANQLWQPLLGPVPPAPFSFLINTVSIAALMVAVFEFLRTEKELGAELVNRYQELSQTQESLSKEELASTTKTQFLASVSHELRTPLGAILGYAELILDPASSEEEKKVFAETVLRNGKQLSRLLDDLLDLTKVEAGKLEIERLNFNPKDLIAEVRSLMKISAQKKNLALECQIDSDVPDVVFSDPYRMKQILMNVIGNAIKFTEKGAVKVHVKRDPSGSLAVAVRDTGRGLTPEERSRLFQAFRQANASVTRKFGGTGLGLNLSRGLANLLGGSLELTWSEFGVGSEFEFKIPLQAERSTSVEKLTSMLDLSH